MIKSLSILPAMLILTLLWMAVPVHAQLKSAGVKTRIGMSSLDNAKGNAASYSYHPGISRGWYVFANLPFAPHLSLNIDAGYSALGGVTNSIHPVWRSVDAQTVYTDCLRDTRLHYLGTALQLRYRGMLNKEWSAYLQAGPAPQLLVNAEQVDYGYGYIYQSVEHAQALSRTFFDETVNDRKNCHALNYTVEAGAGIIWELNGEFAMLELGASRGLRPIEKDPGKGQHITTLYSVTVGYGLLLNEGSRKKCAR